MTENRGAMRSVLMCGPPSASAGGMYAVAATLARELESTEYHWDCRLIDSGGGRGRAGYARFPAAMGVVAAGRYNLLHLHVASGGSTLRKALLARTAKARRRPYVIHLHGGGYAHFLARLDRPRMELVRAFYQHAAAVIVLGEAWRDLLVSSLGCPQDSIHIVHNGVADIGTIADEEKLADRYVAFLGGVAAKKGADQLIRAIGDLRSEGIGNWRLEMLGPIVEDSVADLAHEVNDGSPDAVTLRGPTFGSERDLLLRRASIFALPSLEEALPMSIIEAMSAGLPSIATRVGSVEEILTDGCEGTLIAPGDYHALVEALRALSQDDELREVQGAAARRRWSADLQPSVMARRVAAIWDAATLRAR